MRASASPKLHYLPLTLTLYVESSRDCCLAFTHERVAQVSSIVTPMIKEDKNQGDDRDAILRGAAELLKEGRAPLTRLAIAMRAGVSPQTVSKNFRSLGALTAEVKQRYRFD